ncbi:50S ribosomal protein L3 N(5)-glutamine methyltransferase [Candidatus Methylospira mobilis]|uniref:Ribosomal protein uL3 glutamine methyltransferase n=1 Tax=Candidatus Methylospira mobilis TaxID=1808979 RepID=A0A5Q0BK23_9GAMM|nr:50S ribosomal protein L3 N(5)-glutamine methyltransferase [Candidatus Methylospira mobilis]QFY42517.1 50S ribosomal protein L3 N(5)-glutamine methyltransferase [Candidatus Methylospira mobilis]
MDKAAQGIATQLTTIRDYIRWAASRFNEAGLFFGHGTATATDEAAMLVLHAIHQPNDLPAGYFNCVLDLSERAAILALVARRINERKPASYVTQQAWFAGLPFYVDERVLVPRSPFAELIEQRFEPWLADPDAVTDVLDLCTGSGCIAIATAFAFPDAKIDAVDISPDALAVARINVDRHDLADRVNLLQSDLYGALADKKYDLIVSNPPYVSQAEWAALPPEYHAEPRIGLESGESGLDCVNGILARAKAHLKPGGLLIVEVGNSAEALEAAYPQLPFCWIEFERGGDGVFVLSYDQL